MGAQSIPAPLICGGNTHRKAFEGQPVTGQMPLSNAIYKQVLMNSGQYTQMRVARIWQGLYCQMLIINS
jgi:hypothetical protein